MKEHGKLFNTAMVQAFLEGRKNQTRRVVDAHNSLVDGSSGSYGNPSTVLTHGKPTHRSGSTTYNPLALSPKRCQANPPPLQAH
jgi:hypothetical protein